MKIYISVDLEGIGGVVRPSQVEFGTVDYPQTCEWATREVLAVIEGAAQGGATEFWVKDSHASGINLRWDAFPPGVNLVRGRTRPARFPGLDSSFAALFLVGYHAMAGTEDAVLDHTWEHGVQFFLNRREVGEIAVDAAIAGFFKVPCALVSGDDKTAKEARETLGVVETVIVKQALTAQGAVCFSQSEVLRRLRAGAQSALHRIESGELTPFQPPSPVHFYTAWATGTGRLESGEAQGEDIREVFRDLLGQG